jgi:DNA-directed RNA polymerase specialized sigma24 family protein
VGDEIAAAQGIAEPAARKRVSRALARLRRRLGESAP